jgi:hypothetical protein
LQKMERPPPDLVGGRAAVGVELSILVGQARTSSIMRSSAI